MNRKKIFARFLPIVAWACAGVALPVLAELPAAHNHEHAGPSTQMMLDAGKKWTTDTPLRQAMLNIRNAVNASVPAIHTGKFSAAEYDTLAETIHGEVTSMVRNCKLKPAADAQLHTIIAHMLEGAAVMQGKKDGVERQNGAVQVIDALSDYNTYFDHPGWVPVKH